MVIIKTQTTNMVTESDTFAQPKCIIRLVITPSMLGFPNRLSFNKLKLLVFA